MILAILGFLVSAFVAVVLFGVILEIVGAAIEHWPVTLGVVVVVGAFLVMVTQ